MRRYDSFVVRRWHVHDEQRVEVEHVQSGGRTHADTLEAALTWIKFQCDESAHGGSPADGADRRTEEVMHAADRPADEGETP